MDDSSDLLEVWGRARSRLDDATLRPQHKAWLGLTRPLGLVEDTALLAAPNHFAKDYFENRLRPMITAALSAELGREIRVAVTVEHPDDRADRADGTTPGDRNDWSDRSDRNDRGDRNDPDGLDDGATIYEMRDFAGTTGTAGAGSAGTASGRDFGEQRRDIWNPPEPAWDGPAWDRADSGWGGDRGDDRGGWDTGPRPALHALSRAVPNADARLNPKYTFDTFVIGASNRFTHAATVAVAEAPAKAYNPLFIYGESGLGKTHLLHAVGHYAARLYPGLRVRYVSSEEFTNDFINSLRDDKMQAFQTRYRSVDLLLIDDIQFLERAERTQEEFFHTFNTLHNANKQIVISSDRPPRQLSTLEDRLRTRFEWGLITDVQAPDLETRIAILSKKAAQEGTNPPPEVLEYIASKIQSNIRELEGALIRVTAFASLNKHDVDMGLAEQVLKDLVSSSDQPRITAPVIMAVTAEYFSITIDDLVGSSRSRVLVQARQIAMYLCRELTDLSLPKIGEKFGDRDHTTVMHAERKIRAQIGERLSVYNQITELTNRIKTRGRQS